MVVAVRARAVAQQVAVVVPSVRLSIYVCQTVGIVVSVVCRCAIRGLRESVADVVVSVRKGAGVAASMRRVGESIELVVGVVDDGRLRRRGECDGRGRAAGHGAVVRCAAEIPLPALVRAEAIAAVRQDQAGSAAAIARSGWKERLGGAEAPYSDSIHTISVPKHNGVNDRYAT